MEHNEVPWLVTPPGQELDVNSVFAGFVDSRLLEVRAVFGVNAWSANPVTLVRLDKRTGSAWIIASTPKLADCVHGVLLHPDGLLDFPVLVTLEGLTQPQLGCSSADAIVRTSDPLRLIAPEAKTGDYHLTRVVRVTCVDSGVPVA